LPNRAKAGDSSTRFSSGKGESTSVLESGCLAPYFTLPDQDGQARALADLLRPGPLLLYFYPADFTPGCTREACSIRDLHDRLLEVGLRIFGISPQSAESHRRFRERHRLPFDLLTDADKTVIRLYDVDGPLGFGVRRATFLIDAEGVIRDSVVADLRIAPHEVFVRNALAVAERELDAGRRVGTAGPGQ
jgi:peroxiredoxin Q/BCP